MEKILRLLNPCDADEVTIAEVKKFALLKYDEMIKIRGQIARDLSRLGVDAFRNPDAYNKLARKYKAAKQFGLKKKLAILDMDKKRWCCYEQIGTD